MEWSGLEWCGVVWCGVVLCGMVWCAVLCCAAVKVHSGDAKGNALSIFTLCFLRHVEEIAI